MNNTRRSSRSLISPFHTIIFVALRICDFGGWLDTWFAEFGTLMNIAVFSKLFGKEAPYTGIQVDLRAEKSRDKNDGQIVIIAGDAHFNAKVESVKAMMNGDFDRTNLLLCCLATLPLERAIGWDLFFTIISPVIPGASMGTSAAVSVGMIKAMAEFLNFPMTNGLAAKLAFQAETDPTLKGGKSGKQDQICAASSKGIRFISMTKFPDKLKSQLVHAFRGFIKLLEDGLLTVVVGGHDSSEVHGMVIEALENEGADSKRLQFLRGIADRARKAVQTGDLILFGKLMSENTEAQRRLHPDLIGKNHQMVIDLAQQYGCLGYKVNGAGGEGGSTTLLFRSKEDAKTFYEVALIELPSAFDYLEHIIA